MDHNPYNPYSSDIRDPRVSSNLQNSQNRSYADPAHAMYPDHPNQNAPYHYNGNTSYNAPHLQGSQSYARPPMDVSYRDRSQIQELRASNLGHSDSNVAPYGMSYHPNPNVQLDSNLYPVELHRSTHQNEPYRHDNMAYSRGGHYQEPQELNRMHGSMDSLPDIRNSGTMGRGSNNQNLHGSNNNHDLFTGEVHHIDEELSKVRVGLYAGILCALLLFTLIFLVFFLNERDGLSCLLWNGIIAIVAFFFAIFAIFWTITSKKSLMRQANCPQILTATVFGGCVIFAGYFAVSAAQFYQHRTFHWGQLTGKFSNGGDWGDTFGGGSSFQDGWGTDKAMLTVCTIFSVLISLCFCVMAEAAWFCSKFQFRIARFMVCFLACLVALLAIVALLYAHSAIEFTETESLYNKLPEWYITTSRGFLWGLLILLALQILVVMTRSKSMIVLVAILLLIFCFIIVSIVGMGLRKNKELQTATLPKNCYDLQSDADSEQIKDFCPSKYLEQGQTCTKAQLAPWWERYPDGSVSRTVNPGCCHPAVNYYTYQMYIYGIIMLLIIMYTLLAVCFDFYLCDDHEKEMSLARTMKSEMFIMLVIYGVIFLCLCILALFMMNNNYLKQNPQSQEYADSKRGDVVAYKNYRVVPVDISKTEATDQCIEWDPTLLPVFNSKNCNTNTCGFRVHIQARYATLVSSTNVTGQTGDPAFRCKIFPNNNNSYDYFVTLIGDAKTVTSDFKGMKFCGNTVGKNMTVLIKAEEKDLASLSGVGVASNDNLTACPASKEDGNRTSNPQDYSMFTDGNCEGDCNVISNLTTSSGWVTTTTVLQAKDTTGKWVQQNGDGSNLVAKLLYNNKQLLANGTYDHNTGLLSFNTPVQSTGEYTAQVSIIDNNGRYKNVLKDITVPSSATGTLSQPIIKLVTGDGKGCIGSIDEATCWDSSTTIRGSISVTVLDAYTDKAIQNALIKCKLYRSKLGSEIMSSTTNAEGKVTFENLPYGYYNFEILNSGYLELNPSMSFDEPHEEMVYRAMPMKNDAMDIRLDIDNSPSDMDLNLAIQNENGDQCIVTALDRHCAYSKYMKDVVQNESGVEIISIDQLTVSYYLAFVVKNDPYIGTCRQLKDIYKESVRYNRRLSMKEGGGFDWKKVVDLADVSDVTDSKTVNANDYNSNYKYWEMFCFTGYGNPSIKYKNVYSDSIPTAGNCSGFYPDVNKYSLKNLNADIDMYLVASNYKG